jgi:hypothetical protein
MLFEVSNPRKANESPPEWSGLSPAPADRVTPGTFCRMSLRVMAPCAVETSAGTIAIICGVSATVSVNCGEPTRSLSSRTSIGLSVTVVLGGTAGESPVAAWASRLPTSTRAWTRRATALEPADFMG